MLPSTSFSSRKNRVKRTVGELQRWIRGENSFRTLPANRRRAAVPNASQFPLSSAPNSFLNLSKRHDGSDRPMGSGQQGNALRLFPPFLFLLFFSLCSLDNAHSFPEPMGYARFFLSFFVASKMADGFVSYFYPHLKMLNLILKLVIYLIFV